MSMSEDEKDFFDKFGLSVSPSEVQIGETYPIYGMITKILSEELGSVIVEINYSIEATLTVAEVEKVNLLKERSFEPGIFVSKVIEKEPKIKVDCNGVVFGKRQNLQEH